MVGGFTVALAVLVAWDQAGLLQVGAVSDGRVVQVAGRSSLAHADVTPLAARLRVLAPAVEAPAVEVAAPAAPWVEHVVDPTGGDVAIAPPPLSFPTPAGPAAPPPPPPPQLRSGQFDGVTPSGGTWAVMIGINDYPGDGYDLRSAVNDASDVNDALANLGIAGDRRLVLRDGQATAPMIRASIEWLTAHAGPDATAIFFFAGHIQKVAKSSESLLGSDGAMVSDTEMASLLQRLQAKRAWIALAACYAGGFTEVLQPGRILTAAASADALAYENAQFNRSYLVEYMVHRAIRQKGMLTVEGAFSSAVADLRRDHPNRVPVQHDQVGGELYLRAAGSGPPPANPEGSPPSGQPSPEATPADPDDDCANLTVGVVRCS